MQPRNYLSGLVIVTALCGCATESKSVGTGAAIGALGGAAIGGIADPGKNGEYRTRNVLVGAALGTVAGVVSGALIHKKMEEAKKVAFEKGQTNPKGGSGTAPALTEPKVEARWIEGHAQGNRFIDGHWEYLILEPARWSGVE
jgi:hypothetical protein